jgi:putative tryptophan/tyrosine transport system substrate-binding protein
MTRRKFITLLGGAATWPLVAHAQRPVKVHRIGYLSLSSASSGAPYHKAFVEGLRSLGYVEGENVVIDFRFADEQFDRLSSLANELVQLKVDVIVGSGQAVAAAHRATTTIPIVMTSHSDAVATGLIDSLARPGGNVTGSTFFNPELMAKRLEQLKVTVPSVTRAGVLLIRGSDANGPILRAMELIAHTLNIGLRPFEVRGSSDFESAFVAEADQQIDALVIQDNPILVVNSKALAALAAARQLPSVGTLEFARGGGLMGYGINFFEQYRRAAMFVDKIFKGAKAGDIPVEQATKFGFVINLKTAKMLGLEIPPMLLALADEVIE